jgi:hypothetical protein
MENKNNNEIIDRVKLLMGYKLSMTLNENLSVILEQPESRGVSQETKDVLKRGEEQLRQQELEKEKEEPGKSKQKYIWPIPGYTTYYTPTPNSSKGGQSFMYFPLGIEDNVLLWNFATPSNFPELKKLVKNEFDTAEHFQKILPFGTVRNFRINSKQYLTKLSRPNKVWVFKGYYSGDEPYVGPDPEQYKTEWDKFLEKYKDAFQIIASVLAAIVIEVATAGTGTAFAVKLMLEVAAELVINIPVSIYERKMGDDAAANLSLIFSFLPFLDVKSLRIGGVSKKISQNIAKDLSEKQITSSIDLAKYYDSLETDAEKYLFSQVLQQRPEDIEKAFKGLFKQVFKDPETNKKIFTKLAFKDKTWWKTAGLQLSAAMSLCFMKSVFTTNYSEEQYNKMNNFMKSFFSKVGDEKGQKIIQKTLEIPEAQDNLVKMVVSDTSNTKEVEKLASEYIKQTWNVSKEHNLMIRHILDSLEILDNREKYKNIKDIDSTMLKQ